MLGLDPLVNQQRVIPRVYNAVGNQRLIRRLRHGRSYGGCVTIDVIGCNMLCSYCYIDRSFVTGQGDLLVRENRAGKVRSFTPAELVAEYLRVKQINGWPTRVQITSAEPFLTPDWLIELIDRLQPIITQEQELLWIDTNGVNLVAQPELIDRLAPYAPFLHLFVSSKHTPRMYTAMTRVNKRFADTGFQCLELLWAKQIPAFLQGPITDLFLPDTFQWYLDRLLKIHPAAPLLMDLDRLCYLPLPRIRGGLQSTGLWDRRQPPTKIEKEWCAFLEQHYGRKISRLISVDSFPADEQLVQSLIFDQQPIESCHLFASS